MILRREILDLKNKNISYKILNNNFKNSCLKFQILNKISKKYQKTKFKKKTIGNFFGAFIFIYL